MLGCLQLGFCHQGRLQLGFCQQRFGHINASNRNDTVWFGEHSSHPVDLSCNHMWHKQTWAAHVPAAGDDAYCMCMKTLCHIVRKGRFLYPVK